MFAGLLTRLLGAAAGDWALRKILGTRLGRLGLGAVGLTLLVLGFKAWLAWHDYNIRNDAVKYARMQWTIEAQHEKARIEAEHNKKIRQIEESDETEEAMRMARLSQLERETNDLAVQVATAGSGDCRLRPDLHERVQAYIRNLPLGGASQASAIEADLKAR